MACLCGFCAPDRLIGEPGQVLTAVILESQELARKLDQHAEVMRLAADYQPETYGSRMRRWAEVDAAAAVKIRELVSELCLLSQGIY